MTERDMAMAARLDDCLDALVRGERLDADGLDAGLAATVTVLHRRAVAPAPAPAFGERLWSQLAEGRSRAGSFQERVAVQSGRTRSSVPDRRRGKGVVRLWRSNWVANVATAAVVLLTVLGSSVASRSGTRGPAGEAAPSFELYVSEDRYGRRYASLDPMTLADAEGDIPFASVGSTSWFAPWAASADGSTVVVIESRFSSGAAPEVIVFDGPSGDERGRFRPASGQLTGPVLSRDGSRLVVQASPMMPARPEKASKPSEFGWPSWRVYDTTDGRLLSTVPMREFRGASAIDPTARRLYQLDESAADAAAAANSGPWPVDLVVIDLTTGAEANRLELTNVLGGTWPTDQTLGEMTVMRRLGPTLALAPDGGRLAVVHADEEAVTLVDPERLVVERTIRLERPTTLGDRLLGLLPLVPHDAAAKQTEEATALFARFGPDGRKLYVTGYRTGPGDDGEWELVGLGLRVFDLERGTIAAELSPAIWGRNDFGAEVVPAPDGHSVYVMVPRYPERRGTSAYLLRRLDARTLETLAEREVWRWNRLLLIPAAA